MTDRRLIVNADDFGLTEGVNRAVVDGHRRGIVTSATLMANGRAFDHAVALARETPSLGVGVHLNLTEGVPVAPLDHVASLVGPAGRFGHSAARLGLGLARGAVSPAEVERELRAQIERVLAAGVRVTHLDGHKHVHFLPAVFDAALRLAREYGVSAIRCGRACSPGLGALLAEQWRAQASVAVQWATARMLSSLALRARRRVERAGLSAADRLIGVTHTGFLTRTSLRALLEELPAGTSELMCHPGYCDTALRGTPTRLLGERDEEVAALTSPDCLALVAERGIQLISYGGRI